ncbi:MAG TPA: DUF6335 family protein [Methylomirabilota bacterium]|jgi:hypothetical protein
MKKARKRSQAARRRQARPKTGAKRAVRRTQDARSEVRESGLLREITEHTGVSPVDTGGDLDADWQRAQSSGEETVGGSVATPDQDIVDELARPFGVERPPDAPVITSDEMLNARDRRRWRLEQHREEEARDADGTC